MLPKPLWGPKPADSGGCSGALRSPNQPASRGPHASVEQKLPWLGEENLISVVAPTDGGLPTEKTSGQPPI